VKKKLHFINLNQFYLENKELLSFSNIMVWNCTRLQSRKVLLWYDLS